MGEGDDSGAGGGTLVLPDMYSVSQAVVARQGPLKQWQKYHQQYGTYETHDANGARAHAELVSLRSPSCRSTRAASSDPRVCFDVSPLPSQLDMVRATLLCSMKACFAVKASVGT